LSKFARFDNYCFVTPARIDHYLYTPASIDYYLYTPARIDHYMYIKMGCIRSVSVCISRYGIYWLYSLSFMLYPVIGCVVTIFIGIVVSLATAAVCPGSFNQSINQSFTATGQRAFAIYGPALWNRLPASLRSPELSLFTFRRNLKTHLMGER